MVLLPLLKYFNPLGHFCIMMGECLENKEISKMVVQKSCEGGVFELNMTYATDIAKG